MMFASEKHSCANLLRVPHPPASLLLSLVFSLSWLIAQQTSEPLGSQTERVPQTENKEAQQQCWTIVLVF